MRRCFLSRGQRIRGTAREPVEAQWREVLLEAYEGYERARFLEIDLAVEEVRRRTVMLRSPTRFEDRAAKTVCVKRPRKPSAARRRSSPSTRTSSSRSGGPSSSRSSIGRLPRGAKKWSTRPAQPEDARHGHANGQRLPTRKPREVTRSPKAHRAGVHDKAERATTCAAALFIDG